MKVLWIDLETTGVKPRVHLPIEIAAIYQDTMTKKEEQFHILIKPEKYPDDFHVIEELTGLTKEKLNKEGVVELEAYQRFMAFIQPKVDQFNRLDKIVFAGYNAKFDNDFMRELFARNKNKYFGSYFYSVCLDVASTVAESIVMNKIELQENYKLATVAKAVGIEFKAHAAMEDIMTTRSIYRLLRFGVKQND